MYPSYFDCIHGFSRATSSTGQDPEKRSNHSTGAALNEKTVNVAVQ